MKLKTCVAVAFLLAVVADRSLAQRHSDPSTDLEQRLWQNDNPTQPQTRPKDCAEYLRLGFNTSGLYTVTIQVPTRLLTSFQSRPSFDVVVYCDMETDGGGWTVFQRRVNNSVSFEKNWHAYKTGFGSHEGNFWWGNDNLALALNDHRNYELRVDMFDWVHEHRYATYSYFRVAGEDDNYRLGLGTYAGNAGNALRVVDNKQFTTTDRDNDSHDTYMYNCASRYRGGFWFESCFSAHPNGPYHRRRSRGG